jgi:membrane protein implicated in regulation of membrane protease activity
MTWWSWVIAGAILFAAELTFVSAEFYLVFIGSAAVLVGLITAIAPLVPWAQWALFATLAIISMVTFRSRVYRRFRGRLPSVNTGPVGGVITLDVSLAAGASCQTEHGGTFWTVQNDSDASMPSGTRVLVTGVRGLTLLVRPQL